MIVDPRLKDPATTSVPILHGHLTTCNVGLNLVGPPSFKQERIRSKAWLKPRFELTMVHGHRVDMNSKKMDALHASLMGSTLFRFLFRCMS